MAKIVMYKTPICPYCKRAKDLLARKGFTEVEEIDVSDPEARLAMVEKAAGRRTVPQIFIGDTHVGGFDDLYALDKSGKLDPLLAS